MICQLIVLGIILYFITVCYDFKPSKKENLTQHDETASYNYNTRCTPQEEEVCNFLEEVNSRLAELYDEENSAQLHNEISLDTNFDNPEIAEQNIINYIYNISLELARLKKYNLTNPDLKRQLYLVPELTYEILPEEDLEVMENTLSNLNGLDVKVKFCSFEDRKRCNVSFYSEVVNLKSNDVKELEYYWLEYRRSVQYAVGDHFQIFVDLFGEAAELHGYNSPSDFWFSEYKESGASILENLEEIILQLNPLFKQVHAYFRGKLRSIYSPEMIHYYKPNPEHLLASYLIDFFLKPVPDEMFNINDKLVELNATTETIFETASDFYRTLGMPELDESFWKESCKPIVNEESMFGSHNAWKFYGLWHINLTYNPIIDDYAFPGMFEALYHVHYYRATENLIPLYQMEPVPYFHDALTGFLKMAASSPKYLQKFGIIYPKYRTLENRINRLIAKGLQNIYLIPLYYHVERYRIDVIDKNIEPKDNCGYWRIAEEVLGIQPPSERPSIGLDAVTKFAVQVDIKLTKLIYSIIFQYQLFEHFCTLTGEYVKDDPEKPLDLCDLTGYPEVGQQLYNAMSLGSSVDFKDVLQLLVKSDKLSINGFLEYYKPLHEWLIEQNEIQNNEIGWEKSDKCQPA